MSVFHWRLGGYAYGAILSLFLSPKMCARSFSSIQCKHCCADRVQQHEAKPGKEKKESHHLPMRAYE